MRFQQQQRSGGVARLEKAGAAADQGRHVVGPLGRSRDWRGLIHYGAIFFVLEKLAAVVGVSNLHVYAAMRGETLDDFQKTRNASIQYGVAR